jgi:hypothetical protein
MAQYTISTVYRSHSHEPRSKKKTENSGLVIKVWLMLSSKEGRKVPAAPILVQEKAATKPRDRRVLCLKNEAINRSMTRDRGFFNHRPSNPHSSPVFGCWNFSCEYIYIYIYIYIYYIYNQSHRRLQLQLQLQLVTSHSLLLPFHPPCRNSPRP